MKLPTIRKPKRTTHYRLKGRVKTSVIENGEVIREYPWQDNLILDQGLDMVATTLYNQTFIACAAGTGTGATGRSPGISATCSGTTVTASAAVFLSSDVNTDIVFTTGQVSKIAAFVSATQVTLASALTVSSPTNFSLLYVNQAGLGSEVKRTNSYITTAGANGATVTSAFITLFRTFIFTPESSTVTYTEIGLSPSNTPGNNLFSRILLATPIVVNGPSVGVPGGQQLQVTYQLQVNFDYGSGPGDFFVGVTDETISITNLPISYSINAYATSPTVTGQLAVSIQGEIQLNIGSDLTISGSSVSGYNGTFQVLATQFYNDSTYGPSTTITLGVAYTTTATGGTIESDLDGFFFRACQGIFLIGSAGQSTVPTPTPNAFFGYDEPSITGQAWLSSSGPSAMGSNGTPAVLNPATVVNGACTTVTYTAGTFFVDKQATLSIPSGLGSVSSFGFGAAEATNQIITYCWDQPQNLVTGGTLSLTFRTSWGRVYA